MARWLPLAAEMEPERRRLTERLRLLKDRTGLSLNSLAGKTSYSASSWQRYLNAASLPPWAAVEALGKLGGAGRQDLARLRVLWEAAAEAEPAGKAARKSEPIADNSCPRAALTDQPDQPDRSSEQREEPREAEPPTQQAQRSQQALRVRSLVAGIAVLLLLALPKSSGRTPDGPSWPWPADPAPAAGAPGRAAQCQGPDCEGQDAVRTGCARDGRVLGRLDRDAQRLELKHSPHCGTVWGEVSPVRGSDRLSVSTPLPAHLDERPGVGRTRMLPVPDGAGTGAQVCVQVRDEHACVASDNRSWTD
ncbi:helix-turn-helix domain-containing protein [Streptomyces sp. NPDC059452]|uniref:helix-turn-helix domain-containing protein n=1 Tax=Streptomyces sp. NPDC059452 TaxID=3346835 RepID=UPI00368EE2F5